MSITVRLHASEGSPSGGARPTAPITGGGFGPPGMLMRRDVERHADILRQHLGWRFARIDLGSCATGELDVLADVAQSLHGIGMAPWLTAQIDAHLSPTDFAARLTEAVRGLSGRVPSAGGAPMRIEVVLPADGELGHALRCYDAVVAAVKLHDPAIEVGGPCTSDPQRLDAFLGHVYHRPPPADVDHPSSASRCDFVSVRAEGLRVEPLAAARALVNVTLPGEAGRRVPVVCSWFDRSTSRCDAERDTAVHAAAVARFLLEAAPLCVEAAPAGASDILDQSGIGGPGLCYTPFHGGPGVLTVHDLPKPMFHAFDWLRRLGEGAAVPLEVAPATPGLTVSASRVRNTLRLLVAYEAPSDRSDLALRLAGWPGSTAEVSRVSAKHGSALARWRALGSPDFLNDDLLSELTASSLPGAASVWLATEALAVEPGSLTWIEAQAA